MILSFLQMNKQETTKVCNTLSIAAGIDFGRLSRLNLPIPSIVEELLLQRSRLFVNIVKLVGFGDTSQRQTAKKSHVITYPMPDGV